MNIDINFCIIYYVGSMVTTTIPKKEYRQLVEKALRYDYLRQILEEDIFAAPLTRNIKKVIESFAKTGLYNKQFLKSLEKGLKRSSYFCQ